MNYAKGCSEVFRVGSFYGTIDYKRAEFQHDESEIFSMMKADERVVV